MAANPVKLSPAEALAVLLDQIDYANGACQVTEMIGAVLDRKLIETCRRALAEAKAEASPTS